MRQREPALPCLLPNQQIYPLVFSEEQAIVIWANGEEVEMDLSQAIKLRDDELLTMSCRRRGQALFRERPSGSTSTKARWVKDRGVIGGKYGIPFQPNGHYAQFMLVR